MALNELLPADIRELITEHRWAALSKRGLDWPTPDIVAPELADLLLELDKADRVLLFRALPRDLAAEVFSFLEADNRDSLLGSLTDTEMQHLLTSLEPDDRTTLLGELPGQVTQRLLNFLSAADLKESRGLLGYPEESVGRLMTPDYVAVRPEWTVARALEHIRKRGHESETINVIYIVDRGWKLVDDLPLQRLILAEPEAAVESLMDNSYVSIAATDDREEAVRLSSRYDLVALPVVDSSGVLIGIVTIDDLLDVAEQEATEDFHLSSAVTPFKTSYWQTSLWRLYRSRVPWLAGLVMVSLISSGVIAAFEDVLAQTIALSFFIPLLIGAGGNTGSQSATMMIRAISTGEIEIADWLRALLKELSIGLALGASLGLLGMALGVIRGGYEVGLIVALSMLVMLIITNLLGMALPFILIKLKMDPASASGPLVASVSDAIGLLVYFSIATLIL